MASYTQHVHADGFEINWMKRLVLREAEQASAIDRIMGSYFVLANSIGDTTYFSTTQEMAEERRNIWQAFLDGNLTPMRDYVERQDFSSKMSDFSVRV